MSLSVRHAKTGLKLMILVFYFYSDLVNILYWPACLLGEYYVDNKIV